MSGFSSTGEGKLIGPDGNPVDNESFLASLEVRVVTTGAFSGVTAAIGTPLLFRVVTQKYAKGIVQYGSDSTLVFPNDKVGGGTFNDLSTPEGVIYLEVDLQVPATIGSNSLDGYSGFTTTVAGTVSTTNTDFIATYRI